MVGLAIGLWWPSPAQAEEFKLPTVDELATFSPEALHFYAQGIRALDHVDYDRAYENLVKAAALQPQAVRLNLIVAALALKQGRTKKADEAQEYYETAIRAYQNILATPALEAAVRRDVENRLKIAEDERTTLAQRDAQREGRGNMFIREFNREMAKATKTPKPKTAGAPQVPSAAAVQGVLGGPAATPAPGPAAYPGATPAGVGGMPALPGAAQPGGQPGAPGGMPGLPGLPGTQPGAPGAPQPGGQPGQSPSGADIPHVV
jgi:hypothetical protein